MKFTKEEWGQHIISKQSIVGIAAQSEGVITNYFGCFPERDLVTRERNRKRCNRCSRMTEFVKTRMKRRKTGVMNQFDRSHFVIRRRLTILKNRNQKLRKTVETLLEELSDYPVDEENDQELDFSQNMDDEETEQLVELLKSVLKSNRNFKETFIFKLIRQQLLCLAKSDGRGFRWDPAIVHWALTINYHGGNSLLNVMRGRAFQGQHCQGKLNIDTKLWNLFLPSASTLRQYLPLIQPYKGLDEEKCSSLVHLLREEPMEGGILFDEI